MPKYRVSADEHLYYLSKEIEAKTTEKATDIYLKMIDDGQVEVNESDKAKGVRPCVTTPTGCQKTA